MASDALQEAMVSSGRGEPVASMAAPPTSWLSFSKVMENFFNKDLKVTFFEDELQEIIARGAGSLNQALINPRAPVRS